MWTYTYDNADRLTSATNTGNSPLSETFVYAANDNLASRRRGAAIRADCGRAEVAFL